MYSTHHDDLWGDDPSYSGTALKRPRGPSKAPRQQTANIIFKSPTTSRSKTVPRPQAKPRLFPQSFVCPEPTVPTPKVPRELHGDGARYCKVQLTDGAIIEGYWTANTHDERSIAITAGTDEQEELWAPHGCVKYTWPSGLVEEREYDQGKLIRGISFVFMQCTI